VDSTNYASVFVAVAEDRPVGVGTMPPERTPASVARLQYDTLVDAPYRHTADEVLFGVHALRSGIPASDMAVARAAYFARGQPCLRSSPLAKRYGWGFHVDEQGRVALLAVGTARYDELVSDGSLTQRHAVSSGDGRATPLPIGGG